MLSTKAAATRPVLAPVPTAATEVVIINPTTAFEPIIDANVAPSAATPAAVAAAVATAVAIAAAAKTANTTNTTVKIKAAATTKYSKIVLSKSMKIAGFPVPNTIE